MTDTDKQNTGQENTQIKSTIQKVNNAKIQQNKNTLSQETRRGDSTTLPSPHGANVTVHQHFKTILIIFLLTRPNTDTLILTADC